MLSLQNYVMFSLLNQNHRHLKKWDSCKDTLTTSFHLGTSHLHLFNFIYRWYIADLFLANNYKYWSHIDLLHFTHHSLLKWVGKQGVRGSKGRLGGWSEGEPSARRLWCFYVQNVVLVNNADGLSLFQNIWYFIKAPVWTAVPLRLFERHSSLL